MASAIKLSGFTHVYRAEGCHDLPALVEESDGTRTITTAWQLAPEEHAAVAATGLVMVQFTGIVAPCYVSGPAVEQPPEARFRVSPAGQDSTEVPLATDVLTMVLHHLMNNGGPITVEPV